MRPEFIKNPASNDNSDERFTTFFYGWKNAAQSNPKCLRYQVDWEVKTFNGQPVAETVLLDISAIGARIEGPQPLAQRNHVEFTYVRPGDDREGRHG